MNVFHKTPLLNGNGTNGRKQWQGFAAKNAGGQVFIYTQFGTVGGTIQTSAPTVVESKNVGRANETGLEQQAITEIDAKCLSKQKKDGYLPVGVQASAAIIKHQDRVLPMLAPSEVWPHFRRDIRLPAFAQPKLDGMRLVTDGQQFWSRKGELQVPECMKHLQHDTKGLMIDGEALLDPSKYSFQQSMSAIKRFDRVLTPQLVYCVFDIVDLKLPQEERLAVLKQFFADNPHPRWVLVSTIEVADDEAIETFEENCLANGMEGIMLRDKRGLYKPGKRARCLQKLKRIDDDEFEIVGFREASGGWAGTPVLELEIGVPCADCVAQAEHDVHTGNKCGFDGKFGKAGARFEAKPKMSFDDSVLLYKECLAGNVVGQRGTVLFQSFYDQVSGDANAGKPRFPRVKALRDYE